MPISGVRRLISSKRRVEREVDAEASGDGGEVATALVLPPMMA
ncbi:MAG: hypothetical protein U0232_05145 [Thermomicrobiales bacterium]